MDGIEATTLIREWEKEKAQNKSHKMPKSRIPIIALTANAVSGVREMFIEQGFNDFLAKPIDVTKLDDILNRWIPKDKREYGSRKPPPKAISQFPVIKGIDFQKGINMTGGTEAGYRLVLATFRKDALERIQLLKEILEKDDISLFTTNVHALKSASASIGAAEVSAEAARLEEAGKKGDKVFINENLDKFMEDLSAMVEGIAIVTDTEKQTAGSGIGNTLILLFKRLETALKVQKAEDIDRLLNEIIRQPVNEEIKEIIEKVSDDILMTEFDNAIKTIDKFLNDKS